MFVATASNANSGAPLGATEAGRRQAASDLSIGSGTVGHSPTALPKGKPKYCHYVQKRRCLFHLVPLVPLRVERNKHRGFREADLAAEQ